jgi:uncharacterized protein
VKRLLPAIFAASIGLVFSGAAALAQDFPSPRGFVSDYAFLLSSEAIGDLEARLARLEREMSAEVAIVTVETLDGYSIEEYSVGLFENWGIGKETNDNGVLFIVAYDESEVRIEVGYGLEAILTDGRAGRILDRDVIPSFRHFEFEEGILAAAASIEGYIREGTPPSIVEENPVKGLFDGFRIPTPVLIVLGILTIYLAGFMARTRSVWLGAIWGLILGVVLGFGFGRLLAIILLPIGLGIVGLILDVILSGNYRGRVSSGRSTGWFSSGGGFSGPFNSSGGFGGFGGGRSGGGGASRRW